MTPGEERPQTHASGPAGAGVTSGEERPQTHASGPAGVGVTPEEEGRQARASGLLGLLMVAGAVVVLVDAARLKGSGTTVGPAAAPTLIGILLGLIGGALALQARRSLRTVKIEARRWWRLTAMVALLVAFSLLLPLIGYVLSSAGLFTGAALLLGAPHPPRVAAYGWTLAVLVFLLFDHVIGLTLPTGPWGF